MGPDPPPEKGDQVAGHEDTLHELDCAGSTEGLQKRSRNIPIPVLFQKTCQKLSLWLPER